MPILLCFALLLAALPAAAQTAGGNSCADCHMATRNAPGQQHVNDWGLSPHARGGVACSACHGGNPDTFERGRAHRTVLSPRSARSPLHPKNIPNTCGSCHTGPLAAFQESRHFQLLQTDGRKGPTCVTCHGTSDGRVLSAKALASVCSECHGPKEAAPRAGRAEAVRNLYEGVGAVRSEVKLARGLIRRIDDRARRRDLESQLEDAEVPLRLAVEAGHRFVYDDLRRHLSIAQTRIEAVMSRLLNP